MRLFKTLKLNGLHLKTNLTRVIILKWGIGKMSKAKRSRKIQMKRKQREAKERLLKTSFKKFLEFLGVHTKALTRLNLAFLNLRDEVINARQCLQK